MSTVQAKDRERSRAMGKARTVLVEPVYEALKERIMDQAFPPGARLNIDTLAADLNVSATPVREALARLGAERLVTFTPYKGYTVMPLPSQQEFADLMHVRRLLEMDAARLAPTRVTLADLRAMERQLEAMEAVHPEPRFRDFGAYIQCDQHFHELLVGASGNPVLLATYRGLNVHIQLARLVHEIGELDYEENAVEHRALYDAVRARDGAATAEAVRRHIDRFEYELGAVLGGPPPAMAR